MTLQSNMVEAASEIDAIERFMAMEWSDGLPVVPPTPERVTQLLDYMGMEPGLEIGRSEVRNRSITAEHVATSAVAAGCRPEYMPVIVSALEGVMDPDFHMNHLASTSSPWPMFIVNGPIIEEIGLNDSTYVLGVGSRANMTIGRAISLTLANCMDARAGGVQLGVMGNGARAAGLVMGLRAGGFDVGARERHQGILPWDQHRHRHQHLRGHSPPDILWSRADAGNQPRGGHGALDLLLLRRGLLRRGHAPGATPPGCPAGLSRLRVEQGGPAALPGGEREGIGSVAEASVSVATRTGGGAHDGRLGPNSSRGRGQVYLSRARTAAWGGHLWEGAAQGGLYYRNLGVRDRALPSDHHQLLSIRAQPRDEGHPPTSEEVDPRGLYSKEAP